MNNAVTVIFWTIFNVNYIIRPDLPRKNSVVNREGNEIQRNQECQECVTHLCFVVLFEIVELSYECLLLKIKIRRNENTELKQLNKNKINVH